VKYISIITNVCSLSIMNEMCMPTYTTHIILIIHGSCVITTTLVNCYWMEYLRVDLCESKACCCFAMDNTAKSCLALDDTIWNTHLATQRRQEQHNLYTINYCNFKTQCTYIITATPASWTIVSE